jgi:hypothetical protein
MNLVCSGQVVCRILARADGWASCRWGRAYLTMNAKFVTFFFYFVFCKLNSVSQLDSGTLRHTDVPESFHAVYKGHNLQSKYTYVFPTLSLTTYLSNTLRICICSTMKWVSWLLFTENNSRDWGISSNRGRLRMFGLVLPTHDLNTL